MNRIVFISVFVVIAITGCSQQDKKEPASEIKTYVQNHIDSLQQWMDSEFKPLIEKKSDANEIQSSFKRGRILYKKIEFAIEYFMPATARGINGPPLPEIEAEEHTVIDPSGFQVLDELLFPLEAPYDELLREAGKLNSLFDRVSTLWVSMEFRDDQIFDALRMEMFRTITLGITGFDTPASFISISELPYSLNSVSNIARMYDQEKSEALDRLLSAAILYAQRHHDFDSFDRMVFIRNYINPATEELMLLQNSLGINFAPSVYGLRSNLRTLFEKDAFNPNYFTPDATSHIDSLKIDIGRRLFFDTRISANNKISCATCHIPEKAFSDGLVKNKTLGGTNFLPRNTPTLLYAGLQRAQFYDMRAFYLEDQVKNVIENKDEIHGNLGDALFLFQKDSIYAKRFRDAFDQGMSERTIQAALAAYVRSLGNFNSRFDKYMRGDSTQMSAPEISGFNLFMGKAKCGTCHFMPIFNGTVPPSFIFTESEVIGVPPNVEGKTIDADLGRYGIYEIENFRHAFKTPTVRNVARTAPYMHNGVYKNLEEVMDFYNRGGGEGLGFSVENQTLPFDSLSLSPREIRDVVAFMETLNDK